MKYYKTNISYQEVPDEISLTFFIPGCSLRCKGCHSPFLHNRDNGDKLTLDKFVSMISEYKSLASCILFMGGEWFPDLPLYLQAAQENGFKTCLYTGLHSVSNDILSALTYLKTGPWISSLGGLDSKDTNQRFVEVSTGKLLNTRFL